VLESGPSIAAHGGVGRSEHGQERGDDGGAGSKGGESLEGKGLAIVSGGGLSERSDSMASGLATGVFYSGSADRGGLPFGVSSGSGSERAGLRGDEADTGALKAGTSDRAALAGSALVRGQSIGGDRHKRDVDESTLRRAPSESGTSQAGMRNQEGSDRSVGVADGSVGVTDDDSEVLRGGMDSFQRAATHLLEPASPFTGKAPGGSRQSSRETPVSSKSSRVTPVSNGRPAGSQPAPSGILGFLQGLFSPVSAGKKGCDFTPRTRATEVGERLEDDESKISEGRGLHSCCPDDGKPIRTFSIFPFEKRNVFQPDAACIISEVPSRRSTLLV
jgi:hypothetical protein